MLNQGKFILTIRKNSFHQKVCKCLNRLPREVVELLSWEIFKRCMDVAFGDIGALGCVR